jgi:hypothetical protein
MMKPIQYWSKIWNSEVMQRVRRIEAETTRRHVDQWMTTSMGTAGTPSPRIPEESRTLAQRYGRRQVIADVRKMLADNPLLAEAADDFVDTAVSKSFSVTVENTSSRGVTAGIQRKAQRIIDRVIRDSNLKRELPGWGKRALREGDLFVQIEEYEGQVINAFAMPSVSMERLTDLRDQFADPLAAFRQIDTSTNETVALFARWQIVHGRWNHEPGERYGNSQYLQLRTMDKIFQKMVRDMAVRRAVRATLRRFHKIGDKDHPGKWDDVERYIQTNKLDENAGQAEDYYGTFNVDVKTLEGDAHLDHIKDVEFILNFLFPRVGMPKGIIGFGENTNRDILDDQREFLHIKQDLLIDWIEWEIIRPILDTALMIEDINPDGIVYLTQFEDRVTERQKLARCELYLEMYEAGLMTEHQLIQRVARYINVPDVAAYIQELKQMRAERLREQQEHMKAVAEAGVTEKKQDDPADIARKGIEKSTLGRRGNIKRAAFGRA